MPLPTPADFRDRTKKHSQVREMLAQMAENVESKEGVQEKIDAILQLAKQLALEDSSTIGANLLQSIQVIATTISEFRLQYLKDIPEMTLESEVLNTRVVRLLISIQKLAQTISENRAELDTSIAGNSNAIAAGVLETESVNTRIARLLIAIQQLASITSEGRREIDAGLAQTTESTSLNEGNILRLHQASQQLVHVISSHAKEVVDIMEGFFDEDKKLSRLFADHQLISQLSKLHNFDPEQSGTNKAVTAEGTVFFPNPDNVIRIDIEVTGSLPTAKGPVLPTLTTINVEGQVLSAYGTLEVQGSSSASFPKKNWTLAFFSDVGRTNAIKVKLGYILPQEELVWKANFVDNTHSRNIAVNRIYDQMQLSRSGFPKREVDFVNMLNPDLSIETTNGLAYQPTGATGHVDGFPAVVYINKEFYGLGTLNIGKKRDNYNLKKDHQSHIQLEANGSVVLSSMPLHPLDPAVQGETGEAFEIRRPATWGADAQASYGRLRNFLTLSQADMQAAGIDNYINRKQMMDYIILCQVCDLWDHLKKNTLFTTWDGNVWSFMPYDLDTVFGLWFTGVYFNADTGVAMRPATGLVIPAAGSTSNFGVLAKFRHIYGAEIDARYAELRKLKIIDVDGIVNLCQSITRKFSAELLAAEDARWNKGTGTIYTSLQQTGSIHQIHNWLSVRIPRVDTYFNYTA
ncbi:CotH kinase family protein [Acinetobacter sp. SwsAc7]|nr:CotH kinase family protein [Acinetobacter sp. SwsAc7]